MTKLVISSIVMMLLSFNLFAREEILATTDNDETSETSQFILDVDDVTQSAKAMFRDSFANGKKTKREVFNLADLKNEDGMILEQRKGLIVLSIKSDNFDFDRGGRLTFVTLYHGLKGIKKSYDVDLAKDKDSWKFFKESNPITKMHILIHRVRVIGPVGILKIVME